MPQAAVGADYKATFPVSGVDGSLTTVLILPASEAGLCQNRLARRVKALSDMPPPTPKVVVFSILSNNFNLPTKRITDAIDELVQAIVDDAPGTLACLIHQTGD